MLGLGNRLTSYKFSGGGVSYDATYQAILDYATSQGYTLPSDSQKLLQNQLVVDLKASGIWSKLDTFANFATDGNSNFALIDWKRLTQYTAVNSPIFTPNQGFTGGGTRYIDTNYNPSTQAVNYQLNNASLGTYIRTAPVSPIGSKSVFGTTEVNGIVLMPQFNSTTAFLRFNASSWNTIPSINQVGTWILTRPNSSNLIVYKDGLAFPTTRISTSISSNNIFILRRNDPSPQYWDGQASFFFAGASLTELEAKSLTGLFQTYLNGSGNRLGIFYGDSITAGSNASVSANRWTSVFSGLQSIMEVNFGIAGTTMVQHPTTPTGTSMYERMSTIPEYIGADKYLFFAYGTNDSNSPITFTPTAFETQYNEVIANAKSKGWPASKIKMLNIYRRDDAKEDIYNTILSSIASFNGVQLLDTASVLASNPALYMSDSLHPNDAGHSAIASYINTNIL